MTSPYRAGTVQTFCTFRPARLWCGTRVHTTPEFLATSIAAARAGNSVGSSTCSASDTAALTRLAIQQPTLHERSEGGARPGSVMGPTNLVGVLAATGRNPCTAPGSRLANALRTRDRTGSQPDPGRRSFHAVAASHRPG